MIITLDGPAGSGKSSVAAYIARELGILLLKSGAFYRALGLALYRFYRDRYGSADVTELVPVYFSVREGNPCDPAARRRWEEVREFAERLRVEQEGEQIFLSRDGSDRENVTALLDNVELEDIVPAVSRIQPLRLLVNGWLHAHQDTESLVAEGRDMGSVVFPNADYKFFLDADLSVRAERRWLQSGGQMSLSEVKERMSIRDGVDRNKEDYKLEPLSDGIFIDSTSLTFPEVCQIILDRVRAF